MQRFIQLIDGIKGMPDSASFFVTFRSLDTAASTIKRLSFVGVENDTPVFPTNVLCGVFTTSDGKAHLLFGGSMSASERLEAVNLFDGAAEKLEVAPTPLGVEATVPSVMSRLDPMKEVQRREILIVRLLYYYSPELVLRAYKALDGMTEVERRVILDVLRKLDGIPELERCVILEG